MPVRRFAQGDTISTAIGECNRTGAMTDVILCRPTGWGDGAPTAVANVGSSGFPRTATQLVPETGVNLYAGDADREGSIPVALNVWQLIGITKPAGTATGRAHHYSFSTAEATHSNLSGSQGTDDGGQTLIDSGETIYSLTRLGEQLVAATREESIESSPASSEFLLWNGEAFEPLAGPWSVIRGSDWATAVDGSLWGSDYYLGITAWDGEGEPSNIGLGASIKDPTESSPTSEEYGGAISVRKAGGYLWVATDQPVKVWRALIEEEPEEEVEPGPRPGSRNLLGVGR